MFIPYIYMFRALLCSSSGELIVLIRHLAWCRSPFGVQVCVEPKYCSLHTKYYTYYYQNINLLHINTDTHTHTLTHHTHTHIHTHTHTHTYIYIHIYINSVGRATRYELDSPGIEFRWGRDFPHPSRPTLGPAQHPILGGTQTWTLDGHLHTVTYTRCRIDTINSPDDEHMSAGNM
jgi:hypothetical protein